jgi:drug/metabolite transporter (DMT)-like permease
MWLLFAFLGPIFWALSTHIDKYLVEKYFKHSDTAVLMVFTACIGLVMLPFIWFFQPSIFLIPHLSMVVMIVSGILYMWAMLFYLKAIQSSEASIISPLFQLVIVFTFILGYLILGETLTSNGLWGTVLIVFGALLLSVNSSMRFRSMRWKTVFLMILCTLILAVSSVIFKFFAVHEQFWGTVFWIYVGQALFGIMILMIPKYYKQFKILLKTNTQALLAINGINELVNLGGSLGSRFASLFVPVAIVSAISSTTSLFVFIFGILITIFLPHIAKEDLTLKNLIQKGIAAIFVTIGVFLIQM